MLDRSEFIDTTREVIARYGARLRALVGQKIDATWIAWDVTSDEWWDDEAVIVCVGGDALEIVWWKLNELAITWSAIDLRARPAWVADWSTDSVLEWRRDANEVLRRAVGRTIRGVAVIEHLFRTSVVADRTHPENVGGSNETWILHGIELRHDDGALVVYNGLDKCGVSDEPHGQPDFRRFPL